MSGDTRAAVDRWRQCIGEEHVITATDDVHAAETATFLTRQRVSAILLPADVQDVQECLRIANEHRTPVYPVSSGKNWGYGSRVPSHDGAAILDLRRLNRIVELNEELAYVTVEAGVTQRQLHDHLQRETGGRLLMDATASSPHSSLIGNTMERGHGVTPYCDHVAKSCAYEVVLPTGDLIHTGYDAFPGATTAKLDRWGIGPSLDGLFTQSSLGVVTKMSIWLMPAPEYVQIALFSIENDDKFESIVDALRPLRLSGAIKTGPHLGNVYLSLLRLMKYPWDLTGGRTPLMPDLARQLARKHGVGAWNGVVGLFGTRKEVAGARRQVKKALAGKTSLLVFVDKTLLTAGRILPSRRIRDAAKIYAQMTGGLGGIGLPRAYWRKTIPAPEDIDRIDLDRDGCGLLYLTAVTPFRGTDARAASDIATEEILRCGFEPNIGIFPIRDRALHFHISIPYDRDVPGDDEKVLGCREALSRRLYDAGYFPHRLSLASMSAMDHAEPGYRALLARLKKTFDPNGILAPGRYGA